MRVLPKSLFILLFLPGTILHELSHYIVARLLLVRTGKLSVEPKYLGQEIILGSVAIEKVDVYRRALIGVSPIIFGLTVIFLTVHAAVYWDFNKNFYFIVMFTYMIFVVANTMFSSKKDLEGIRIVLVFLFTLAVLLYLLGLRVNLDLVAEFEIMSIYLAIPVLINTGLLLLLRKCHILNYGR